MNIIIPNEALDAFLREVETHDENISSEAARAACLAMLKAWQTDKHKAIIGVALDEVGVTYPAIILPLPQEKEMEQW